MKEMLYVVELICTQCDVHKIHYAIKEVNVECSKWLLDVSILNFPMNLRIHMFYLMGELDLKKFKAPYASLIFASNFWRHGFTIYQQSSFLFSNANKNNITR